MGVMRITRDEALNTRYDEINGLMDAAESIVSHWEHQEEHLVPDDVKQRMEVVWMGLGDLFVIDSALTDEADHFDLHPGDAHILLKEIERMLGWLKDDSRIQCVQAAKAWLAKKA